MSRPYIRSNKLLHHIDRLQKWSRGEMPRPITVEVHPSDACNHNCYYCFAIKYRSKAVMSRDMLFKAVDRMASIGVRGLLFSGGGEPYVNRNTSDAILRAVDLGLKVGVITNGGVMQPADLTVAAMNCEWIRFSMDAVGVETYRRIRGVDDLTIVESKIRSLISMPDRRATVGVQMVVGPENKAEARYFALRWSERGADYVQIRPTEGLDMPAPLLDDEIPENVILSDKFQSVHEGHKPRCRGHWAIGAVNVRGEFYLCCHTVGQRWAFIGSVDADADWLEPAYSRARLAAYEKIDYEACPRGCRGFGINSFLEEIVDQAGNHSDFL